MRRSAKKAAFLRQWALRTRPMRLAPCVKQSEHPLPPVHAFVLRVALRILRHLGPSRPECLDG